MPWRSRVVEGITVLTAPVVAMVLFIGLGLDTAHLPSGPIGPKSGFDVGRAMEHVKQIAKEPHPVGSKAHGEALAYVVEELRKLPLEVEVQGATVRDIRITNVLARPRGAAGSNVVLLAAHYDSVRTGPGAGDDAAGTATVMEAARVLSRAAAGSNEVAFLITDAEERGLEGAEAFVRDNGEFMKRVKVVLNFEARGNRGPVVMFETGPRNLELMRLFRECPYPMATSFAQDVYRRMPNDTDLSVFLAAGAKGYNFSVIMGLEAYHRPSDTWQNLDRRSVAHYGSYATTLGRRLANADLDKLGSSQDGVFFPLVRGTLVVYPESWAMPLAVGACCLFGGVVIMGVVGRRIRILRVLLGVMITIVVPAIPYFVLGRGMRWFTALCKGKLDGSSGYLTGYPYANAITLISLGLTVAVVLLIKVWLSRRLGAAEMMAGSLVVWLVLAVGTAWWLRGFSYLLVWPALFGTMALRMNSRAKQMGRLEEYGAVLCSVAPGCLLFSPAILLAYHALTIGLLPVLTVLACLVAFLVHVPLRTEER